MDNKKKIIIASVIGVMLLGGAGTGAMLLSNKKQANSESVVATQTDAGFVDMATTEELAEVTTEEKTKEAKTTEEKTTESKKEDKKKDDSKGKKEQVKETTTENVANDNMGIAQVQNNNSKPQTSVSNAASAPSGNTTQAPSTTTNTKPESTQPSTQPSAQPTTEAPSSNPNQGKKKVWVVDREAFDDEYPIYETVYFDRCANCGKKMYNQAEVDAHIPNCAPCSWYSDSEQVLVGYGVDHYPEEGHWEWQ